MAVYAYNFSARITHVQCMVKTIQEGSRNSTLPRQNLSTEYYAEILLR